MSVVLFLPLFLLLFLCLFNGGVLFPRLLLLTRRRKTYQGSRNLAAYSDGISCADGELEMEMTVLGCAASRV